MKNNLQKSKINPLDLRDKILQMAKEKAIYREKRVDHATGEVTETKWVTRQVADKEQFVILYIKHIGLINKLPHSELKFLLCCAGVIEWNTNDLVLGPKVIKQLCECTGLTENTIRNAVYKLLKKNILQKKQSNWYVLNPDIFFYGRDMERTKMFELTYQWEIKD